MEDVVDVVIPLGGVELGLAASTRQTARIVALVFQQQVEGPLKT